MRVRLALAALLACAGSLAAGTAPASACMGPPCDQINAVCKRVGGSYCLG